MDIKNSVVAVTGGAYGLGEAVARNFVDNGGKAVILDLAEVNGSKLAAELGAGAIFVKTDVTREESVRNALSFESTVGGQ